MSDNNLPEINFKKKEKEKKGGFVGWIKNKLGFGSNGSMGSAGVNAGGGAMNAGRAVGQGALNLGRGAGLNLGRGAVFGTSKMGATGIAGLLAGKGAIVAAAAVAMVAGGIYLATYSPSVRPSDAFSSSVSPGGGYVPAILRSQAANQGSSLDMFKDTNKGKLATEAPPPAEEEAKDAAPAAGPSDGEPEVPGAEGDMAAAMAEKLKGGIDMASLTTQLGGGDNKFSGLGGFENKFNQGAVGNKTGFSSGAGSGGFSAMPKFDSRKQKMLAMKAGSRPVFGTSQANKKVKIGSGAYGQAKGVRNIQKSYTGSSADNARATQDKAWEGTTADGSSSASGGAGVSDGGAGIVSSPSLDNVGGVSGGGVPDEGEVPDGSSAQNVSPWQNLIQMAMMLIMFSAMLSAAGSMLIKVGRALMACPFTFAIGLAMYLAGVAMCLMAIAMGVAAIMMGMKVMSAEGQSMLGMVYMLGGGVAVAAGVMGLTGANMGAITPIWMSAIAGIIAMMGSMFAGKFNPPTGM